MVSLPRINSYGKYSSDNYGAHSLVVDFGRGISVWFSYRTPIAFTTQNGELIVRQNDWGPITGKHLNWIDGGTKEAKAKRVNTKEFEQIWNKTL